jgi:ribonuclease-3
MEQAADDGALSAAQAVLGHAFARPDLLREALTHRSAAHDRHVKAGHLKAGAPKSGPARPGSGSNERLEFVGDRVLGLLIAEWLAERFPDEQEGQLGPRHAQLVSRPVLAEIADTVGLAAVLAVAPNEARSGIRGLATVLSDALEAVIGALYQDGGLEAARRFVRAAWAPRMHAQQAPPKDPKTALQEWALGRGMALPAYRTEARSGPSHAPVFTIAVAVAGREAIGRGTAGSKREAERLAAQDLLGQFAA